MSGNVDTNNTEVDYNFELYKLLYDEKRHNHTRWIDNYKITISFNSILLATLSAILIYILKEPSKALINNTATLILYPMQ